jgi:CRP/FNR family transcriptional regulator, nitrogen oxide reductase regulator
VLTATMSAIRETFRDEVAESRFLGGINGHCREEILGSAQYRRISPTETVIQAGAKATHLFLVATGSATYYRLTRQGDELLLRWLIPGDVFGLATLLKHPAAYMGSVQAGKGCEVYAWKHASLCELSNAYPQLAVNALQITLGYLSDYAKRHADLVTETAEQRLANTLIDLGLRLGRPHQAAVQVDITNEQLGSLADVSRFTASRILSKWERKGAMARGRGKILIRSPEKLLSD